MTPAGPGHNSVPESGLQEKPLKSAGFCRRIHHRWMIQTTPIRSTSTITHAMIVMRGIIPPGGKKTSQKEYTGDTAGATVAGTAVPVGRTGEGAGPALPEGVLSTVVDPIGA